MAAAAGGEEGEGEDGAAGRWQRVARAQVGVVLGGALMWEGGLQELVLAHALATRR